MPRTDNLKALLFDTFGTVVDWRNGITREAALFLARHGSEADAAEFADAWRSRYQPAMDEVRNGRRPFVPLDVLHRESLFTILPDFGISLDQVAAAELDALNLAWHRLDPWPDSVEGLRRLKERFIIASMSNANIRLIVDMARHAGLPWDAILGAEVAQAYKPSPETYLRAIEILGLQPEEICMVAAHNYDLAAARECRIKTAFVHRTTEYGPQQTTDLQPSQDWDFVAGDLLSLATQLDA
jgi:2-haloacid dehalogenase